MTRGKASTLKPSEMIVEESDPVGTAAAVDRLVHHSVILVLYIENYWMEAAMKNKSKKLMTRQRALNRWILGNDNL